uniref:Uncharacterized protein n=1 Tax=Mycena chlorophos TaxID=658473 RepID=A0ABQ0M991_MYCCL|nr:predicted protein [Mycena chlorophos]
MARRCPVSRATSSRNESSEMEGAPRHQLKKRTLKKERKKRKIADSKLLHGNKGRFFYFQCLQLVLRHQVAVLIEKWALPSEFEVVCKDLWTLHLSLLQDPIPEEMADESGEEELELVENSDMLPTIAEDLPGIKILTDDDKSSEGDAENDAEIDQLLAENSESESENDDENADTTYIEGEPTKKKKQRHRRHQQELVANTLAILVLAFWTLRIPILYRDLLDLVQAYEVPYLDVLRILPADMVSRLNRANLQALTPPNAPSTLDLHDVVSSLARRMHETYGVLTPEANAAPILWRVVSQCFGANPTLYKLAKRLAARLSLSLTLHHSLAPPLRRVKDWDPESHKFDNIAPELAFAATCVIVLKLVYGFDGQQRLPADVEDPACEMPRVDEYRARLKALNDDQGRTRDAAFSARREITIEDLSDDMLDDYLSFCATALVGCGSDDLLDRYFPLDTRQVHTRKYVVQIPCGRLGATRQQSAEDAILKPGQEYALGGGAEGLVGRVGEWLGIDEDYIETSVFVARRDKDKDASKPDVRRSTTVLTPIPTTPILSSGKPDDEPVSRTTPTKRSWTTWLGKKGTIKRSRPPIPVDDEWVDPMPQWQPSQPAPILKPPPPSRPLPPPRIVTDVDSVEDASDDDSDSDDEPMPHLQKTVKYIQNSLIPPLWAPSPFARPAGTPLYPRSANGPRALPVRNTLQAAMHKTRLLRRLHDTDQSTRPAQLSLLPFASHPPPPTTHPDQSPMLPWYHIRAPPSTMTISDTSAGLRRWMSRPCFEERFAVWFPDEGGHVVSQPVQGSAAAVAELEYSPSLEALIGFDPLPVLEESPTVGTAVANSTLVPSPLRNSALKPSPPPVSPVEPPAPGPAPTTSRVHFAEDDKDDVIPLGYALRMKKRREEKAKFLRAEQERRAFEMEKAKQEAERRKRELERKQWEDEKRAWEREKKAMEEERKKRIYAEEVASTRARREHQRAGGGYGVGTSMLGSSSSTSLRDERRRTETNTYSRPVHDQRRQASEPAQASTPSSSPHTSSPSSSRPPSVHQTGRNSSRPPSVHSSSEEFRPPAVKRGSMASLPGKPTASERSSIYSLWSSSNPALMPPVPQMPMYSLDMPLLPPTAPFMGSRSRGHPGQRSQGSRDSSPGHSPSSPSRHRLPSSNSSSDRIHLQHHPQPSSRRGSNVSGQRPEMGHQRRSSDDARRATLPPPTDTYGSLRSTSSSSLSRGRAPRPPSSFQPPPPPVMPWTAPPLITSYSQQQLVIASGPQWTIPPTKRRQTTIS